MHIHTTQATAAGNAMAGAQAAETSIALRRARELREKADKIKALSSGSDSELSPNFAADPQVISMLGGWAASATGQGLNPIPAAPSRPSSHASAEAQYDFIADGIADPVLDQISVRSQTTSQIRSQPGTETFSQPDPQPASQPQRVQPASAPNPAFTPVSFWA